MIGYFLLGVIAGFLLAAVFDFFVFAALNRMHHADRAPEREPPPREIVSGHPLAAEEEW